MGGKILAGATVTVAVEGGDLAVRHQNPPEAGPEESTAGVLEGEIVP